MVKAALKFLKEKKNVLLTVILLQRRSYFVCITLSFFSFCGQHVKTMGCVFCLCLLFRTTNYSHLDDL